MRGLSPVAVSWGHSSSRYVGLSPLRSTGSRRTGSAVVAHGPSCSAACGILPDQGSNPCPLHWQADSQPLRHQGSPSLHLYMPEESHLTIKLLEENIGKTISDVNSTNVFLGQCPKAIEIKAKINKWVLIKHTSFCTVKETINKMKTTYGLGENICK